MIHTLPWYVPTTIVLVNITFFIFWMTGLTRALRLTGSRNPGRTAGSIGVVLLAWIALQATLGLRGFYLAHAAESPRFLAGIVPPLMTIAGLFAWPKSRRVLDHIPLKSLTYIHSVRFFVELVVFALFVYGQTPRLMTFLGRNPDILIGVTAPVVGYLCFTRKIAPRKLALAWHMIGLALLVNVATLFIFSVPSPFQLFAAGPANTAFFYFPFIWAPTDGVPTVIFAHCIALRQLIRAGRAQSDGRSMTITPHEHTATADSAARGKVAAPSESMRMTSCWHLYVGIVAFLIGVPCLLFPAAVPAITYAPPDLVWVRITGMCLVGYAYFNYVLSQERDVSSLQANVFNLALGTVVVGMLALTSDSAALKLAAAAVAIGFAGTALSFRSESRAMLQRPTASVLPRTARWNWYVAAYTFVYGTATAVFPHQMLPLLGFDDPVLPWSRISGLLFYVLCVFNVVAARKQGTAPIILAILTIRIWFVAVLIVLGLAGYPWFLYASAAIVVIGITGTVWVYRSERRSLRSSPPIRV